MKPEFCLFTRFGAISIGNITNFGRKRCTVKLFSAECDDYHGSIHYNTSSGHFTLYNRSTTCSIHSDRRRHLTFTRLNFCFEEKTFNFIMKPELSVPNQLTIEFEESSKKKIPNKNVCSICINGEVICSIF